MFSIAMMEAFNKAEQRYTIRLAWTWHSIYTDESPIICLTRWPLEDVAAIFDLKLETFKLISMINILSIVTKLHQCLLHIVSRNDLVPSYHKPLSEPMVANFYVTVSHH